jgi:hypothetical protein
VLQSNDSDITRPLSERDERPQQRKAELAWRVSETVNAEVQRSRRAALNVMKDAIQRSLAGERAALSRHRPAVDRWHRRNGRSKSGREVVASQGRLRVLPTELNLIEQRERQRVTTDLHD